MKYYCANKQTFVAHSSTRGNWPKLLKQCSYALFFPLNTHFTQFSFIVCLSTVTLILIATFRPHTAGLHQAIVSIYWFELFVPPWLLVVSISQTSLMVGGFRYKALLALWEWAKETDPSAVRCGRGRLLCCLMVGIHAAGISVPLSLLMLPGWSLMWIAPLTLREYQWGSRSTNLTPS